MTTRLAGRLLSVLLVLAAAVGCSSGAEAPRGLWLLPRKDAGNTARADVPARMAIAPHEVWSYGGGGDAFSFCRPVTVGGKPRYFGMVRTGLRLVEPDGRSVWENKRIGAGGVLGVADFLRTGGVQAVVALGSTGVGLVDVADGKLLWSWNAPSGAYFGSSKLLYRPGDSRLVVFPQNTLTGLCFRLPGKDGQPELLWTHTYDNAYWVGYGPHILLADMDNSGGPEIVLAGKPGYAAVIDLDSGAIRSEVRYQVTDGPDIGRPYGLVTAEDLDGDGYRDIVVASCQVEEYVAVIRNVGGKGLAHVWSQFIEKDYPEDHLELRPNLTSVADVDGDGKRELVVGLFNTTGDGKWHTVVFDAMKGYRARLLDLPDRYFWGCYDLTGDGRPEIITSTEHARRTALWSTIQAVDGVTGKDLATVPAAALSTAGGPLPLNTGFMALRHTPIYLSDAGGLLIHRGLGKGPEEVWRVVGGRSSFTPLRLATGARTLLLSSATPKLAGLDRSFKGIGGAGGADAGSPRVSVAGGERELVLALSDGRVIGGQPDWGNPGRFRRSWTMPGAFPNLWLGPSGERVVCTVGPLGDEVHIGSPTVGELRPAAKVSAKLPYPMYGDFGSSSRATLLPFGDCTMQLFVGLQTGVHTLACTMLDASGKRLWLNPAVGPYPRNAAAAKLEPGGPWWLIVNDHYEKYVYSPDGKPGMSLAYGSSDGHGHTYTTPYALPIVGPYGPAGETRIILTPGLDAVQALDAKAAIVAQHGFSTYEFEYCGSAPALVQPGVWAVGMVNHEGLLHCFDMQTGEWRWKLDMGSNAGVAINVSTVDIDGDGRDNFLVSLPNGNLVCVDERDGKGVELWRVQFDAAVRDAYAADINGDGFAELIVETDDGRVRVLAGEPPSPGPQ